MSTRQDPFAFDGRMRQPYENRTITRFGQIFVRCPECGDLALDPRTDECLTCLCTCETFGHCEVCR